MPILCKLSNPQPIEHLHHERSSLKTSSLLQYVLDSLRLRRVEKVGLASRFHQTH